MRTILHSQNDSAGLRDGPQEYLQTLHDNIQMRVDIHASISGLIDGWCQRRALRPLAIILPVWPPPNNFSEDWQYVWSAMKHLLAMCRDDLAAHGESESVHYVLAELSQRLFPSETPQEIEQAAEQILRTIFGDKRT